MTRTTALALALAVPALSGLAATAPLAAQAVRGPAVVDLEKVVQGSSAYNAAVAQINATYAANIQQLQALQQSTNAQLQPLAQQVQAEQQQAQPNQANLQTYVGQINQIRGQAQQQASALSQPIEIARAYVTEQVADAIRPAVQRVAQARQVTLVVPQEAALYVQPANDLTNDVVAELNRSLPQVGITPPAEWLQQRGLQAGGQPAAASPTPQPQGR